MDRGITAEMRHMLFLSYWSCGSNDLRGSFGGIYVKVNRRNEVSSDNSPSGPLSSRRPLVQ